MKNKSTFSRRGFITSAAAGAAAIATIPSSGLIASSCAGPTASPEAKPRLIPKPQFNGKPKRGVSLYSYTGVFGVTMTMEDCFIDINDMEAEGIEILANGHIPNYPDPSEEWVDWWFSMLNKYNLVPAEYGHWVDSRRQAGRTLTSKESFDMIVRDIKLAHKLGFKVGRTKLGVIDETLTPVENWKEFIKMALPVAEENDFVMCPEIHMPTVLKSKMVDDYVDFIVKTGTRNFGLNIDFGVFSTKVPNIPGMDQFKPSQPEDIIPLLPYVHACHAKFGNMSDDLIETTHPYPEIIKILVDHKWEGYLLSEYEGPGMNEPEYASDQVRRQHVMLKRLLGEA